MARRSALRTSRWQAMRAVIRALVAAPSLCLLVVAAQPALAQQAPTPQALTAQTAAAASWPHTISREGSTVTVFQPQAIE